MRINIFVKTFIILLVSFSAVFFFSNYITLQRFPDVYIEENVSAIKETIVSETAAIQSGVELNNTDLINLSSETSFIRYQNFVIVESIGPSYVQEADLLTFVLGVYGNEDKVVEGNLTYYSYLVDDVYRIDYIYEFEYGDYLIISTRFQSLTNVDRVLSSLNLYESIAQVIVITLLSAIISFNISRPLRKINLYAKNISDLHFDTTLKIKRNDEFRDLVGSLNEMTFNLQKTYSELHHANDQLSHQIDFEQQQEQQKQRFIMTINHELKTPLAVMKGMIEGMIDQVGRYKEKEKYLPELLHQIDLIERITSDFTFRLRLEDKITKGETTSSQTIVKAIQELDPLRQQLIVTLQVDIPEVELVINDELLGIVTTNLVKNAMKYATGNPVVITGTIQTDMFVLMVRNPGVIAPDDLANIFESFYRADRNQQDQTGTGLGLFIVKEICQIYQYEYKLFNDNNHVVAKIKIPIKKM